MVNYLSWIGQVPRLWSAWGIVLLLAVPGCGRNEIKVYRVAKETPAQQPAEMAAQEQSPAVLPQLTWTLPDGWQEKPPSEMRVASFAVPGKDGQSADVSVIPLPGVSGRDLDLVNLWRSQVNLAPIGEAEMAKQTEPVAIGSDQGKLFDLVSTEPMIDGKFQMRIVVAMLTKNGTGWFFKMTGEDSLVRGQKPVFVQFLKSIGFQAGAAPMPVASAHGLLSANGNEAPGDNSAGPLWSVPSDWKEQPASQFLLAKFLIAGNGGARAEVNVSVLGGEGGGLLANVNRWRGQLGLTPIGEMDLPGQASPVDVAGGKAVIVDLSGTDAKTGQKARLIGAVVPQAEQTWFYKLMGDEQLVAAQKEAFMKFLRSAKYSDAH